MSELLVEAGEQSPPRQLFEPKYAWDFGLRAPFEFTYETLQKMADLQIPVLRIDTVRREHRPDLIASQTVVLTARGVSDAFMRRSRAPDRHDMERLSDIQQALKWSKWANAGLWEDAQGDVREAEVYFDIRAGRLSEEVS